MKALVVDLDGTLLTGNSLKVYLKSGLIANLRRGRIDKVALLSLWMGLRRLKLISHARMKFACASILRAASDARVMQAFSDSTHRILSASVATVIEEYKKSGAEVLIATAAFDFYVPFITDYQFVATRYADNEKHIECRGENKVAAVNEWCQKHNCEIAAVMTDHVDDLPLLMMDCPKRYVVNPKPELLAEITKNHIANVVEIR